MKGMFKISIMLSMFCSIGLSAYAQRTVTGTVTGVDDGQPLIGVNVIVVGTSTGTYTDLNGNFAIQADDDDQLEISYLGYETQIVDVDNGPINIQLASSSAALDEVVVTAFGMKREKKALPYSVTQLDGEKFSEVQTTNVGNALSGKVAGVFVTPPSSGVAGSSRVTIRGGSSLGSSDQPLYVINGVPMNNNNFGNAGLWGGNDGGDGLAAINPDDIESISVLKGSTASALYGSLASNGVILITTKSGKARKGMGISFNSNLTVNQAIDQTDWQQEYGPGRDGQKFTTQNDALDFGSLAWGERYDGSSVIQFDGVERPYSHTGEDINDFYRTGFTFTNSLALSGGNDNSTYRFSISDLQNEDIMPNSGFVRRTAGVNLNSTHNKLTLALSAQYTNQQATNRPRLSDSPGNANFTVTTKPGNIPYSVIRGNPDKFGAREDLQELRYQGNVFATNPYWAAYQFYRFDLTNRLVGNASLKYDFTDWLYIQGRIGLDFQNRDEAGTEAYGTAYKPNGSYNEGFRNLRQDNYDLFIGGEKKWDRFSADYLIGGNILRVSEEQKRGFGNDLVVPFLHSVNNLANPQFGYNFQERGINSIFGSLSLGWDNWLFLNLTGRQEEYSTLSPEENTLFYPSVGVGAILSEAMTLPRSISFLKFRASYAQTGGGLLEPYQLGLTYGLVGSGHLGGILGRVNNNQIPNSGLTPFTLTELELGFDLRMFRNRLGIDFTYYDRTTENDILAAGISASSGYTNTLINIGELTNKGVELLLNGRIIQNQNLSWEATFNFSYNLSEAVNLGNNAEGEPVQFLNLDESRIRRGERIRHILGEPLRQIVGYTHKRNANGEKLYTEEGFPVRSDDVEILGEGTHPIAGGLSSSLRYKNFNVSFLVDFRQGGSLFSGTNVIGTIWGLHKQTLEGREGGLQISGVLADDESTPINMTIAPEDLDNYYSNLANITEYFVQDASFGRLRELSIGYNFSPTLLANTPIQSARISLIGRNLALLWSSVENIDPESSYTTSANAQGLEFFALPQTRNFGLSLSLNF